MSCMTVPECVDTGDATLPRHWFTSAPLVVRSSKDLDTAPVSSCALQVTGLGKKDLAGLGRFSALAELEFASCDIDAGTISQLANLEKLRHLYLASCEAIGDSVLEAVYAMIPQLKSLVLYDCAQITDVGVGKLPALRDLRRLRLDYVWEATDISGEAVGALDKLEELSLGAAEQLTDVTLQALGNLRNLKSLILPEFAEFSARGLCEFFSAASELRRVSMTCLPGMTDEVLALLAASQHLEYLYLLGCGNVTGDGITQLSSSRSLRGLGVHACKSIPEDALRQLRQRQPNWEIRTSGLREDEA